MNPAGTGDPQTVSSSLAPALELLEDVLTDQQRALHQALSERDTLLSTMYLGGLAAFVHEANPERLPQCAHSLRELIEKIPALVQVPTPAHSERLGDKVQVLSQSWDNVERQASSTKAGDTIDRPLAKFLVRVREFFDWRKQHLPRRSVEVRDTLRTLDPSGRSLPERLEELNVKAWIEIREFFVQICHHRRECSLDEFGGYLGSLERLLLDGLRPKTFADFDTIDALIAEGESDA